MPLLHQHVAGPGLALRNYSVSTPTCCPSRLSLLTSKFGEGAQLRGRCGLGRAGLGGAQRIAAAFRPGRGRIRSMHVAGARSTLQGQGGVGAPTCQPASAPVSPFELGLE